MTRLTPEQVAAQTLDAHAIRPHWNRNGEQVAALIAEAVGAGRDAESAEWGAAQVSTGARAIRALNRRLFERDGHGYKASPEDLARAVLEAVAERDA